MEEVKVEDSILWSIKKLIGLDKDYGPFDVDLKIHINASLNRLWQNGIGSRGYRVTDETQTWEDFIGSTFTELAMAVEYVYAKCRLIFDPPQSSAACEILKATAEEMLWCARAQVDPPILTDE